MIFHIDEGDLGRDFEAPKIRSSKHGWDEALHAIGNAPPAELDDQAKTDGDTTRSKDDSRPSLFDQR